MVFLVSFRRRNEDGSLTFSAGNICIHFYTLNFLKTKCSPEALPKEYHIARKKIPYANPEDGASSCCRCCCCVHGCTTGFISPYVCGDTACAGTTVPKDALKANNGIKLESFIFDVCALSDAMAVRDAAPALRGSRAHQS